MYQESRSINIGRPADPLGCYIASESSMATADSTSHVPWKVEHDENGRDEQQHFSYRVLDADGQNVAILQLFFCK